MIDETGESPFGVLALFDYYIIHKLVQADCRRQKGWNMEVYVSGAKGIGFLDLYDVDSNQYYEVKSEKSAKRGSTRRQMEKYDVSYVNDNRFKDPIDSPPTRGNEYVSGTVQYGAWDVEYRLDSAGLITYATEYNWDRGGKVLAGVAAIVLAIATHGYSIPFTVPAFA